jgi:hypothetical protein
MIIAIDKIVGITGYPLTIMLLLTLFTGAVHVVTLVLIETYVKKLFLRVTVMSLTGCALWFLLLWRW